MRTWLDILSLQEDLYYPHSRIQDMLWECLHKAGEPFLTHWPLSKLRQKALATVLQHIHYEDENTRYVCIGPVNKVTLPTFNESLKKHTGF